MLACGATCLGQHVRPNAFGNALGESLAAGSSSRGDGTTRSPYVDPNTGDHIVFGGQSNTQFPDLSGLDGGTFGNGYVPPVDRSGDMLLASGDGFNMGQGSGSMRPRPLAFKPLPQRDPNTGLMGFDQGDGAWTFPVADHPAIEARPLGELPSPMKSAYWQESPGILDTLFSIASSDQLSWSEKLSWSAGNIKSYLFTDVPTLVAGRDTAVNATQSQVERGLAVASDPNAPLLLRLASGMTAGSQLEGWGAAQAAPVSRAQVAVTASGLLPALQGVSGEIRGTSTAMRLGTIADDALAESTLLERVSGAPELSAPIKNNFQKGGVSTTLEGHLSTGGPSTSSVYGAHSEVGFQAELSSIGGQEVGRQSIGPGIYEVDYVNANGKPLQKTTYDARYTDQQMTELSQKASQKAWTDVQVNGPPSARQVNVVVDDVPFIANMVYDKATGRVTQIYSHPGRIKW